MKGKFSDKGKAILGTNKPTGLADFLNDQEDNNGVQQSGNTDIHNSVQVNSHSNDTPLNNSTKTVRADYRFPEELSERLRRYAFDKRRNKTDVVIQALEEFFSREGY